MRRTKPKRLPYIALAGAVLATLASSASAAITRQYAYTLGKKGKSTSFILRTAFPGVRLVRQPEAPIRVLLAEDIPLAVVMGQGTILLRNGNDDTVPPVALPAGHRFSVTRLGATFTIKDVEAGQTWKMSAPPVFDSRGAGTGIRLAEPRSIDRRYRGVLRIQVGRLTTLLQVVNVLDVEPYLKGTLPGDMPSAWGVHAPTTLRAGAVALRSRALAQRKLQTAPYDFTANDPRYLGLDGERPRTNQAVVRTRNLTLKRAGWPYPANFSGIPAMGSSAFQPRPGSPVPVAFGPEKPVPIDPTQGTGTVNQRVVKATQLALSFRGTPYRWGGSAPGGFDCSGLLYYVFRQQGINIPRVAADQAKVGKPIRTQAELQYGDAVFFADSSGYVHHIGIYIGNGQMVHSPHTGDVVKVVPINTGYYLRQFAGGRRYS